MFEKEDSDQKNLQKRRRLNATHRRNWMRHTAMVPKGFIRFQVLSTLNEKPMSGSELMEIIEMRAGGFWKPSPGSIYPLLAWLQDSGYVKELPTENGMKRYELTESGKLLLDEQKGIMRKFRETMGFPQTPFRSFFTQLPPEKAATIRETMHRAAKAMFELTGALHDNFSGQELDEAVSVINEASKKLEDITKKIKGEEKND